MNAPIIRAKAEQGATAEDRPSVVQQLRGIIRLELRQNLLGRRSFAVYALAFFPVPLLILWNLSRISQEIVENPASGAAFFAGMFEGYLKIAVFLSALILFMSLFRSEILQRSLHYYLLTPVRREVLVLGKYISAFLSAGVIFATGTVAIYLLLFLPLGLRGLSQHLFQGPGLGHLVAYVGIVVLACAGYGSVFLLAGLLMRNPVVAAVLLWGWESINIILPAFLKKFSVTFYLQSLYPVPLPMKVLELVGDPISPWLSVPGLLLFTIFVLFIASIKARWMEISYGGE
jgi:ABC-type transport system involved in multi-copper enzyme maturation permease subunit